MEQLCLFPEDTLKIQVEIYADDRGYRAQIAGGWWAAWGKTPKAATENVKRRYQSEQDYLNGV